MNTQMHVRMPPKLLRDAKRMARRRETTVSDLVRQLIEDAMPSLTEDALADKESRADERLFTRATHTTHFSHDLTANSEGTVR